MEQKSVLDLFPWSDSSKGFISLAKDVCEWPVDANLKGNIQFLWKRLIRQKDWREI